MTLNIPPLQTGTPIVNERGCVNPQFQRQWDLTVGTLAKALNDILATQAATAAANAAAAAADAAAAAAQAAADTANSAAGSAQTAATTANTAATDAQTKAAVLKSRIDAAGIP